MSTDGGGRTEENLSSPRVYSFVVVDVLKILYKVMSVSRCYTDPVADSTCETSSVHPGVDLGLEWSQVVFPDTSKN